MTPAKLAAFGTLMMSPTSSRDDGLGAIRGRIAAFVVLALTQNDGPTHLKVFLPAGKGAHVGVLDYETDEPERDQEQSTVDMLLREPLEGLYAEMVFSRFFPTSGEDAEIGTQFFILSKEMLRIHSSADA